LVSVFVAFILFALPAFTPCSFFQSFRLLFVSLSFLTNPLFSSSFRTIADTGSTCFLRLESEEKEERHEEREERGELINKPKTALQRISPFPEKKENVPGDRE